MAEQIITKECSACKQVKPISEFYQLLGGKFGISSWCKKCTSSYMKKRYQDNKEEIQKQHRIYKKTKKGKEAIRRYDRKRYKNNPEKILAYCAVRYAIRIGKIKHITTLKCLACNEQAEQYHHPNGYTAEHKFDIIPLCKNCHNITHKSKAG